MNWFSAVICILLAHHLYWRFYEGYELVDAGFLQVGGFLCLNQISYKENLENYEND